MFIQQPFDTGKAEFSCCLSRPLYSINKGQVFFVKFSCQVRPIIIWSTTMKTISILFRSKVELDEERVRSLREKDGLKRQLEDLVVVERDQMVKTAASDQAQVRECEDEVERMADIVKSLQSELAMTTKKLQVMI